MPVGNIVQWSRKYILDTNGDMWMYGSGVWTNIGHPSGNAIAPTTGLVAHWTFNEEGGLAVYDSTPNGSSGTLTNGATRVSGIGAASNKAVNFDGVDDYIEVGDLAVLNVTDDISISLWFKTDAVQVGSLVSKLRNASPDQGYHLAMDNGDWGSAGTLSFRISTDNVKPKLVTANSFADNQWHHVVAIYKSDGVSTPKIYVDGAEKSGTVSGNPVTSIGSATGYKFRIGRYSPDAYGFHFKGLIDDVRIYNQPLSSTEVSALYAAGP